MVRDVTSAVGVTRWLNHADRRYIATRFLYWKGFIREHALSGALAMECFLKAFLIDHGRRYPLSHDLSLLLGRCADLDHFFRELMEDPNWEHAPSVSEWLEFEKYPEPRPGGRRVRVFRTGSDDLFMLDCVAHRVHRTIGEREKTEIQHLLGGKANATLAGPDYVREASELFLKQNAFFDRTGGAVTSLPAHAWRPPAAAAGG